MPTCKRVKGSTLTPKAIGNTRLGEAVCAYSPLSALMWQLNRQGPHPHAVGPPLYIPSRGYDCPDGCTLQSWAHLPGCKHHNKGGRGPLLSILLIDFNWHVESQRALNTRPPEQREDWSETRGPFQHPFSIRPHNTWRSNGP
ncbi:hypothetical protein SRHO_G00014310 [Serrasalmus rhombeus]